MVYVLKKDKYSSHSQIAKMIAPRSKVLDVGCSSGQIGKLISNYIVGIDRNKEDLEKSGYNKKILLDIEKGIPALNEKFGFIVFADVIEHTVDPEKLLMAYKKYLEKNGKIIVSLPNIANIYIRLKLLFGVFNYQERGILDRTHLRFFTLKSAKKMFADSGFEIEETKVTPIPVGEVKKSYAAFSMMFYWLSKLWPKLFGYQFIFKIRPK